MRFHKMMRFGTKVPAIIRRMNRVLGWQKEDDQRFRFLLSKVKRGETTLSPLHYLSATCY
jgi:hypothetical protein